MATHKARPVRMSGELYEGRCSCGWATGPKDLSEIAYGLLRDHVDSATAGAEAEIEVADTLLSAIDTAIAAARLAGSKGVTLSVSLPEAVRLRGIVGRSR